MSALFQIVPWYWRWAAVAALVAAFAGYFYFRGYLHEERQLDLFQAQVEALGRDAAAKAAATKTAQDQTTKEIRDAYAAQVASVHAYYARRLRSTDSRSGAVPAASDSPGSSDGAASQCVPGDESDAIELEARAAEDAAKVLALQDFLRRNNFPVR